MKVTGARGGEKGVPLHAAFGSTDRMVHENSVLKIKDRKTGIYEDVRTWETSLEVE